MKQAIHTSFNNFEIRTPSKLSMHAMRLLQTSSDYIKRVPLKGEAPPGKINLMLQPVYKPSPWGMAR